MTDFLVIGSALWDYILGLLNNFPEITININGKEAHYYLFEKGAKGKLGSLGTNIGGAGVNVGTALWELFNNVSVMTVVGDDVPGDMIKYELEKMGINTDYVTKSKLQTGQSFLLTDTKGERNAQTFRSAAENFEIVDKTLSRTKNGNVYVSSLGGDIETLGYIFMAAKSKNLPIFFNPGGLELEKPKELMEILQYVSVLSLNKQEAQKLVKGDTCEELVRALLAYVPEVIVSDGENGLVASDGKTIVTAGIYDVEVVSRTGAGDAFFAAYCNSKAKGESLLQRVIAASKYATKVCCLVTSRIIDYSRSQQSQDYGKLEISEKPYIAA